MESIMFNDKFFSFREFCMADKSYRREGNVDTYTIRYNNLIFEAGTNTNKDGGDHDFRGTRTFLGVYQADGDRTRLEFYMAGDQELEDLIDGLDFMRRVLQCQKVDQNEDRKEIN